MVSEAIALVGTDQDGRRYGSKLTRKGSHCGRDSAQWLAYAIPCRRFTPGLAASDARLGADVDRYSFTVVDFHHLLLAGLPAHRRFELRCDAGWPLGAPLAIWARGRVRSANSPALAEKIILPGDRDRLGWVAW